ncbi:thiamine transporter [Caldalkalibacillus uzonensis]|uniref:Thiamine transporter n=1 Tax=Caldalkalibacillus uzonensis TaxID=353224 RepID=A0ABU0CSF2_9BACI|nr:energy-coupled thiamine transporter ThiT [Caldalkalibacillus uzonensis]MDQ0339356.1 thiamine transporter [Caldalkalibacillus uzonensis]
MERERLLIMVETAVMAAVAYVFSFIKFGALWAYGGSISLVMVPIFVLALRRGLTAGLIAGLIVGIIKVVQGGYVVHPVQLVLDYPLAYALLGTAGLFALHKTRASGKMMGLAAIGIVLASGLRFLSHFISGVVWFGAYAPEGMPVATYSALYNLSYLLPEMIISLVIMILLIKMRPQLFKVR